MGDLIYIAGHKNPDTDSICSAIAYANLKEKQGIRAIPVRLGEINRETAFVLEYFNVPVPEHLVTVRTQVCDLQIDPSFAANANTTIRAAWGIMKKNNIRVVPVVDEEECLLGIVTLSDITNNYMDAPDNNIFISSTPLQNIVETLNAKLIVGSSEDFRPTGKVVIAAMTPEGMTPFIGKGDIVLVGNRNDSQQKAIELGANCLIITCNGTVESEIIKMACQNKSTIIVTPGDTFMAARLINQSLPIDYIMTRHMTSFNIYDYLDDIKDQMLMTRFRSYPVVDQNNRIKGFISRYHLISHRKKKIILLDHNERNQTVDGIEQAEIIEIIDHHRVGDIQTGNPIHVINEPVGSTATIIAGKYLEMKVEIPPEIAGILVSAIISDTIMFRSPTCTAIDRNRAETLAKIAGIEIAEFATLMFQRGSSLEGKTPRELVFEDLKDYVFGKYKIGVAQINTIDRQTVAAMKNDLIAYMNEVSHNHGYHLLMLLITDVVAESSEVLYVGKEKNLMTKAFQAPPGENSIELKGVVSRKKQVIPNIAHVVP